MADKFIDKNLFQEIEIARLVPVQSDTEVPVSSGYVSTQRPLCAGSFQNKDILNLVLVAFNQADFSDSSLNLFKNEFSTIKNIDDLKRVLSELLIRFDTAPKNYTKSDYLLLLSILSKSLLYIYDREGSAISSWSEDPSDTRVPTEKLVKLALDLLANSKQDNLIPGINIKTINGRTLLEQGDLYVNTYRFRFLTLDEYDALSYKDPDIMYFIWEDEESSEQPSVTTWKFGDPFPIVFGARINWKFGDPYPLKF